MGTKNPCSQNDTPRAMLFYAIASAQTFGGLNQGISRRWSAIVPRKNQDNSASWR
jgi:hypothetical protein